MLKRIAPILATGAAAAVGLIAIPAANASAVTYSNVVNNCYGEYYNTDWNQDCDSPGATDDGYYYTTAVCDYQSDKSMTVYRGYYSTAEVDGTDCTFDVDTGYTVFWD
ncbi:hypothetical protein [Streptomyces sp. NPDC096132]|uniref:hypothetical protein n=1 Tax=Streptomyces sp. NPDC096132 TaxID=3366075 RepID=UPI0038249959